MSRMKEVGMKVHRNEHMSKDLEMKGTLGSSVNRN